MFFLKIDYTGEKRNAHKMMPLRANYANVIVTIPKTTREYRTIEDLLTEEKLTKRNLRTLFT